MTGAAKPPTRRVLIVEDEMIVSMLLEDFLTDLGCEPVGPAARLDDALTMARNEAIDAALLDLNLNGKETHPVADILMERGIPFAFATGYGPGGIPERYRDGPVLPKPFRRADLERVLARLMGPPRR